MKKIGVIFLIIGCLFLVGAALFTNHSITFQKTALRVQGTVVGMQKKISKDSDSSSTRISYSPIVDYTDLQNQSHQLESNSSSNPPSYEIGEKVEVLYQPGKAGSAQIDSWIDNWLGPVIIGGFGGIFSVIGLGVLFIPYLRGKQKQKLMLTGTPLKAKVISVELNTSIQVNNRCPFNIVCQSNNVIEKKVYVFRSSNIWFDPTDFIENDEITVYIDKRNPKKYWVDISFLPQKA